MFQNNELSVIYMQVSRTIQYTYPVDSDLSGG